MENQNNELYKFYPIPNFPWYLINKMGQIWCKEHKYVNEKSVKLKQAKEGLAKFRNHKGYNYIDLLGLGTFKVADLVAYTFLLPDFNRRIVNHKNKIRYDDKLENLEYVNFSENCKHRSQMFSKYKKNKIKQAIRKSRSYPVQQILNGKVIKVYDSCYDAQRKTGFNNINKFARGKRKSPNGYEWEYVKKDKV